MDGDPHFHMRTLWEGSMQKHTVGDQIELSLQERRRGEGYFLLGSCPQLFLWCFLRQLCCSGRAANARRVQTLEEIGSDRRHLTLVRRLAILTGRDCPGQSDVPQARPCPDGLFFLLFRCVIWKNVSAVRRKDPTCLKLRGLPEPRIVPGTQNLLSIHWFTSLICSFSSERWPGQGLGWRSSGMRLHFSSFTPR